MDKFKALLKSRKFWALVAGLSTIWGGYASGGIPLQHAIDLTIGALSAYAIGTGLETPAPTGSG